MNKAIYSGGIPGFFDRRVSAFVAELREVDEAQRRKEDYHPSIQEQLNDGINQAILACRELEQTLGDDNEMLIDVKKQFREAIAPWFSQSVLMSRGLNKPGGHPGDYETLEAIYDNQPLSEGMGRYLDQYFLNAPLAVAVRNRKDCIRDILHESINNGLISGGGGNILNIASGSCRELFELLKTLQSIPVRITCVDYDQESIDFSRNRLVPFSQNGRITFVNDNVLKIAVRKDNEKIFGRQDLIYSVDLYDYLSDKVLKRVLIAQMNLLKPGGKMILAFKDSEAYDETGSDWFLDWQFVQRTEPEVLGLLDQIGINGDAVTTSRDQIGIILFCVINKK